ncbi:hypothetical protein C5167_041272 [Papaver somniferum]|uniref:Uncharacterized protein n=1 Tax=Papaver somniferum TaxID=3469 RepID=A0A4Y7ILH9_PAPSO|nr:hypothetical protein C5167_041272 [Papaver somniferum]
MDVRTWKWDKVSPKKVASKPPQVRRRLGLEDSSQSTQASVVGDNLRGRSSSTPVPFYADNDDSDNDGVEVNDQGKEGEEDLEYYNNFRADNSEFDDEPGDLYCSHYYTVVVYGATYSPVVLPIPSQEDYPDLEEHEDIDLEPPIKIRKSGRPRVKRRRAWMSLKHLYRHIHVQDVVPLVTTKVHVKVVMLARILKLRGKEFK